LRDESGNDACVLILFLLGPSEVKVQGFRQEIFPTQSSIMQSTRGGYSWDLSKQC